MRGITGFAGYSNAGKTSLIVQLIRLDVALGLQVGVIKHTHHPNPASQSRGDTKTFLSVGAVEVVLTGKSVGYRFDRSRPPSLFTFEHPADLPGMFGEGIDRLYVEGYKSSGQWPRVIVDRASLSEPPVDLPALVAAVTDRPWIFPSVPTFTHDQVEALRSFLDRMPLP